MSAPACAQSPLMLPLARRPNRTAAKARRPAFVLPVVLVLIGLLALTLAGFMFFVRSELAGAQATRDSDQARLAAESGLQEVIVTLRTELANPAAWYDAPDRFRHTLVWSEGYDRQSDPVRQDGNRQEVLGNPNPTPAWRYSIVAPNFDGVQDTMRFGITPEAGKLNLNAASENEIELLVTEVCNELRIENAPELVACLLDWLDEDDEARSGGAEADYYSTLTPAYRPKNGPLDSLEELLLIKGWSSAVLYGEDTNRNGILDANENDGDASFPTYDNADGQLAPGLYPFVTLWSREPVQAGAGGGGGGGQPQIPGLPGGLPPLPGQPGGPSGPARAPGPPGAPGSMPRVGEGEDREEPESEEQPDERKESGRRQSRNEGKGPGADGDGAGDPGGEGAGEAAGQGDPATGAEGEGEGEGETDPNSRWGPHVVKLPNGMSFMLGRVNVNAAPERVLRVLDGMTPDAAARIVAARKEQAPEALKSTDWLVSAGALDAGLLGTLQKRITTTALQFHVEAVGYADHTRLTRRLEWIIEVRGPVTQVLYHRDLTSLGFAWPIDDDSVVTTEPTLQTGGSQ